MDGGMFAIARGIRGSSIWSTYKGRACVEPSPAFTVFAATQLRRTFRRQSDQQVIGVAHQRSGAETDGKSGTDLFTQRAAEFTSTQPKFTLLFFDADQQRISSSV